MINILAQCPSCGEWISVPADEHTLAGYPHELLADVMCPSCYEVSHIGNELNWKPKRREFVDEETGIRLALEPKPRDPERMTVYLPDDERAQTLTYEEMQEAIKRLMAWVKDGER